MDDKIAELIESQAETRTLVQDMHQRLFGNGQPGVIAELNTRISAVEKRVWWASGVGAAIATGLSYLGFHIR